MEGFFSRRFARRGRLRQRLLRHHLPLLVVTGACTALLYFTRPYADVLSRASFATAYPALVLLAATLTVGPWKLMRVQANPVSNDLRRDLGIWAGVLGILHTAVGQCVHLRGRPWLYYIYGPTEHHHGLRTRHDLFGFANYTGAMGVVILAALFVMSNDYSLGALGAKRWKSLQRWNYAIAALSVMHAFAYQGIEKQRPWFVGAVAASTVVALAFQIAGIMQRRSSQHTFTSRVSMHESRNNDNGVS
jgi:methionine sulfoxide reductase heme-binding subunit